MIKAILFDMDDLMVNSAPFHMESSKIVFEKHGIDLDEMTTEEVADYFGKRVIEIIEIIIKRFGAEDKIDFHEILKEREDIFIDLVKEKLEAMPGLMTLIERLKETDLKRAVASSGTKDYIDVVLNKFSLTNFFEAVISGDMVENGKPAPDVFLKAAKTLGVEPGECLVLEDAAHGVTAAKAAGMHCIAVKNSVSVYTQDLSKADLVVNKLSDITLDTIKSLTN